MADHTVVLDVATGPVRVPTGTLLSEAARQAGVEITQPCGGQGRCGRCTVQVTSGAVRRRSILRLSPEDLGLGYALACQTVIEGDVYVHISEQEVIERRLTTDRTVAEVVVPLDYDFRTSQSLRRIHLRLSPPRLDDQTDDLGRLLTILRQQMNMPQVQVSLNLLQKIGAVLRTGDWQVTAIIDAPPNQEMTGSQVRLIDLLPGLTDEDDPLWGAAIDIGTTTVTLWLVDLVTGEVKAQVAEYNGQIARGEDVISRIIYSGKNGGREELQSQVLGTINSLVDLACKRVNAIPSEIYKATVAGNSTMTHLFLGIPPTSIRLAPFITGVNQVPFQKAGEIGLNLNHEATVDCLPGVASYVGSDITAGVSPVE
jgi:uncharacterized 2Fe-2S/4Fe-4S cluster protein (DUF4445 family)